MPNPKIYILLTLVGRGDAFSDELLSCMAFSETVILSLMLSSSPKGVLPELIRSLTCNFMQYGSKVDLGK